VHPAHGAVLCLPRGSSGVPCSDVDLFGAALSLSLRAVACSHWLAVFALSALRYRAGRAADAALARARAGAPGWDESVRWLASVWAKGAWEGGCVAECAKALQLARGLDVSAARERRRLAGPAALAADVEE